MATRLSAEVTAEDEVEVLVQAFDAVRKVFEGREWIMQGRGNYPYDDDRYKEEVRYMYNEFEKIRKDTWANVKSKSVDYRKKIIADFLADNSKVETRIIRVQERIFENDYKALLIHHPKAAGVIYGINQLFKMHSISYSHVACDYANVSSLNLELANPNWNYLILDGFGRATIAVQEALLEYLKSTGLAKNRRIIISVHSIAGMMPELMQVVTYFDAN